MAYSIGYGNQPKPKYIQKKSNILMLTCLFFIFFLLMINIFWQDGAQTLRQMLLPFEENTIAAFEELVTDLSSGTALSDAVTAFCQDVIGHAQIP